MQMDNTELVKLASELTDRVDALEVENRGLRARLGEMTKQAAVPAEAVSVVSQDTVDCTLDALIKVGALDESQRASSREKLLTDAESVHRVLQHVLDAQIQEKTAAESDSENLRGGRLAGEVSVRRDAHDDCFDKMARILGLDLI